MTRTQQDLTESVAESLLRVHRQFRHYPDLGDGPVHPDVAQAAAHKLADGLRERDTLTVDLAEFREIRTPNAGYVAGAIDAVVAQIEHTLTIMCAQLDMVTSGIDLAA